MCSCKDPKTGEVKEIPAKTKEMIYRMQAPNMQAAIEHDKSALPKPVFSAGGKNHGVL